MVEMRALISRDGYFNPVEAYYNQFNHDRTASNEYIEVPPSMTTRVRLRSVSDLFAAIRRFGMRGEKSFIIGTHGNPNGLPIRIRQGNPVTLNAPIMQDMSRALAGSDRAREDLLNMISLPGNSRVFRNAAELDSMLGDIRTIRGFRLDTLEFRGCNIGAGPALRALHKLLGARITDGPRVQFFWSTLPTAGIGNLNSRQFANRLSTMGPDRRVFTDTECYRAGDLAPADDPHADTPAVVIGIQGQGIRLNARSRDVLAGFAQAYLQNPVLWVIGERPPGGGYRPGNRISIIGFLTPTGRLPFVIPGDGFTYTDFISREINPVPINLP